MRHFGQSLCIPALLRCSEKESIHFGPTERDRERFSTSEWHMSVTIIIYDRLSSDSVKKCRMNDYDS